jgi:hypothetical protein
MKAQISIVLITLAMIAGCSNDQKYIDIIAEKDAVIAKLEVQMQETNDTCIRLHKDLYEYDKLVTAYQNAIRGFDLVTEVIIEKGKSGDPLINHYLKSVTIIYNDLYEKIKTFNESDEIDE